MIETFTQAIYFILPAYVANIFPVIFAKINLPLGIPISETHLGKHKTYRGFYAGYLGALLILAIQKFLISPEILENSSGTSSSDFLQNLEILNYQKINIFYFAFLFGFGALFGDAVKSFFKRKLKKNPGSPWFPFDQLDLIFGSLFFLIPLQLLTQIPEGSQTSNLPQNPIFLQNLEFQHIFYLIIATPILHLLSNIIAYCLGLKKVWW